MNDKRKEAGIPEYLPAIAMLPPDVAIALVKAHGLLMNAHGLEAHEAWTVIAKSSIDRAVSATAAHAYSDGHRDGKQTANEWHRLNPGAAAQGRKA